MARKSPKSQLSARVATPAATSPETPPRLIAVIDIGATAIRMEIAEMAAPGRPRTLESLSQPVNLGKDAFSSGALRRETIEDCVDILRRFRQTMGEFGIRDMSSVRAVATSAVQEAANREQFIDRVFFATGIPVECVEDIELSRLTYLAVRDLFVREAGAKARNALVVEVGGGSTEVLHIRKGRVVFSETYRLGSLRLRETIESGRWAAGLRRRTLEQDVHRTVDQMRHSIPSETIRALVAMSGDARLAAARLAKDWSDTRVGEIDPKALNRFVDELLDLDEDAVARRYRLSHAEAENIGPALLAYCIIAREFGVRRILVPKVNLRTALEMEMAGRPEWIDEFNDQVRQAADALMDRYGADRAHAEQVAELSGRLFDALRDVHGLCLRQRFLLDIAARLHEIGLFINNRSHHKHSMYAILNSDLFGLSRADLVLVALIARYHRRSPPQPDHPHYGALPREAQMTVQKLAAILRVADALERCHLQRVRNLSARVQDGRLTLTIRDVEDLTIERMALREKGGLFEDMYGLTIELERGSNWKGSEDHV